MSWSKHRRWGRIVIMSAATGCAWIVAPRSALAATNDGKLPSSVSGCSSNFHVGTYTSNRIKAKNSLTGKTEDYGWWEWRYSNTGSCKGYQWVRLHIEHTLVITLEDGGYLQTDYWRMNNPTPHFYYTIKPSLFNDWVQLGAFATIASALGPGTYNGRLLYSPNTKSCSTFATRAIVHDFDFSTTAVLQGAICG